MKQLLLELNRLLDVLFPQRPDAALVATLSARALLKHYHLKQNLDVHYLLPFKEPAVKACLHELKFHNNFTAAKQLGVVLDQFLANYDSPIILIPIPLSAERLKDRGYNQVSVAIAEIIHHHPRVTLHESLLKRNRHTVPQSTLTRVQRLKNVQGAFSLCNQNFTLAGQQVLILDDVTTTGATLQAAKTALRPLKPASISCVALAH